MKEKTRKLKDQAAELMRKGKYPKALKNLQQVKELDPEDLSVYNNIGYLLRKLDQPRQAAQVFAELAEKYTERGFLLKAAATYKVILEFMPNHSATKQKLEQLCSCQENGVPLNLQAPCQEPPAADSRGSDHQLEELALEQGKEFSPAEVPEESAEAIELPDDDFEIVVSTPQQVLEQMREDGAGGEIELELEINIDDAELQPEPEAAAQDDRLAGAPGQQAEKARTLPRIPFLGDLPAPAFAELVAKMKLVRANAGDWIIREKAHGDSMFVVTSGRVRVLKRIDDKRMWQIARLGEGSFFGEMAVLRGGRRTASVQAEAPTELLEVTRETLDEIIAAYPEVEGILDRFMTQRLLRNVMHTSQLFKPFSPEERIRIIERFVIRNLQDGELVVTQGQEAEGLFVMLRGSAQVFTTMEDDREVEVGVIHEGEVFGEISCLKKRPATASVRAKGPAVVLRLPRQDFDELVLGHPQLLELMESLGEEHLAETLNTLAARGVLL